MTMESLLLRFPQELVDSIIRANDRDEDALCSCALVCRAFLPASQAGLFSVVHINPGNPDRAQQLFDLLVDSPRLRRQVLGIEICDAFPGSNGNWDTTFLAGVIALCGLLESSVTSFGAEFYALNPSPELRAAICELCQRAPLISLHLAGLGEVTSSELTALLASSALKELFLWNIIFPLLDERQLSALNKGLRLTRCTFRLWNTTLRLIAQWLVDGDSLSSLRYLLIAPHPGGPLLADTASHFQNIIDASLGLEEVILRLERILRNPIHVSLSNLANLRMLSISFMAYRSWPRSCAELLADIVEGCSKILVNLNVAILLLDEDRPIANWAPLDSALSPAHFPLLTDVKFTVTSRFLSPDLIIPKFVEDIRCGLPDLYSRGILKV
ncbi:hypothetical protein C8R47DRAFT_618303 [Mycena vitilis]|nr:hypothetical protein C8R47DRAFT_618303 [Mycena vitilis]